MNVLYVNTEDLSKGVASGRVHFWAICRAMRDLGCRVTVVAPRYHALPIKLPDGISGFLLPVPFKNFISLLLFELLLLLSIPWVVLRYRPAALLVRGGGPGFIPGLIFLGFRMLGVRVVLECNGITWEEFQQRGFSAAVTRMVRFSAWQQARACHHVIGVTQEIGQTYCRLAGRPLTDACEIPNGVDPDEFNIDHDLRHRERQQRRILPAQFVVGYVGSFSVWHGILPILDAVEILRQTRPTEVLFVLVGDGECFAEASQRKELRHLDNLLLPGAASDRHDLRGWMTCFDVGLCPNMPAHGSPLKYFEYLACGIPVIGSGAPQLLRFIRSDNTGVALDVLNGEAIAEAIEQMLSRRETWQRVGVHNRKLAAEKHSWKHVAARVVEVLKPSSVFSAPA